MKVRILRKAVGISGEPGQVIDLPRQDARRMAHYGFVEIVRSEPVETMVLTLGEHTAVRVSG